MKKLLSLAALSLILAGCSTFPKGQALQLGVQTVSLVGTIETIRHEPKTKPKFQSTVVALDGLIAAGQYDTAGLTRALTNLPTAELQGPEGQIIVAEGAILINWLSQSIQIDTTKAGTNYVKPVAHGLRDGIKQGVALSP